jgi:putative transposase
MDKKTTCNAVYKIDYHVVWCTKYRRKYLSDVSLQKELEIIFINLGKKHNLSIENISISEDHVHMFVGTLPSLRPSDLIKILKGASSRILLHKCPEIRELMKGSEHFWSPSYYIGTVGDMSAEVVKQYIENQKSNV